MIEQLNTVSLASTKERTWLQEAAMIIGGSVLIALFAPLSIHLPFTPVPIALHSGVVLFLGAFLGSKRGSLAVLAYLLQGAMGLPVFAGGKGGIWVLAGPTGGYLLSYVIAAYVTGLIIEKAKERTLSSAFWALICGTSIIYLMGALHLSLFVGISSAFALGVLPFIIGDFLKVLLALKALKQFRFFS